MANTTTNHYHLIVLGADIAGLVAAALVARRGKRVLVIPHGPEDGSYRLGQRSLPLDTAPVIHMPCATARRVFHELGLLHQIRREHAVLRELVHVVLPDQRLDLQPGNENWLGETRREWPDDHVDEAWELHERWSQTTEEVLGELLESDSALEADGFWSRRFLSRVANQLPAHDIDEMAPLPVDHPVRIAARAVEPWLQHLSPVQLGKAASLRLSRLWLDGPEDLPQGQGRLRKVLLQRIALHSGEIKRELRVADILVRRGKINGVSLLGKDERYGCDHLIIATDPRSLLDGPLPAEQLPRQLSNIMAAITPVAHRFVVHVEIDERGLSPALDGMVVCVPEQVDEHGAGLTYVRVRPGSVENTRLLSITRILRTLDDLPDARERVLEDLDERGVLPFARPYVRLIHSPHDGREPTNGDDEPLLDLGPGSTTHLPMSPLYTVNGEPSLGVGVLPHSSGIKHVHLASRLTLPGLGLEGEFAAGFTAAGLCASAGKTPLMKRSVLLGRA